ncbi:glycoside hydrolase family 43 protein [Halalkalibacter urbisdiaboli]|uniref:glycoside hydrolase family 43 protein n=1 Tax=Halalkalibacter urbisdiaboli TaxID=1960589 RepID=UPI000B44541E|nr:family 43 glycosylhydrolase [Halalkalibacter urbisdiaboli]
MVKHVYNNPIVEQRADPWVYKHSDGYYYFTASVPEYDRIELRRSKTIQGLNVAEQVVVWRRYETGPMSANIWAPELHYIQGKWYIYFAAGRNGETNEDRFDHRMYVLENDSENPLEGSWSEKGQLKTNWESFSLDATTFEHNGFRYLVWPQRDPNIKGNSNLYIALMENPWTITGQQIMISQPEFDWEKIGYFVNEGPAVLKRNGKIFITYSASATDHHYCMGLLVADEKSDLLSAASWTKSEEPVLKTNEDIQIYGPGHNSFTVSEDGTEDVLIFHARNYKEIEGNPLNDPNRHMNAIIFGWDERGFPVFDLQEEQIVK